MSVDVRRTGDVTQAASVHYFTSGGVLGALNGTLNFAAGETVKSISVPVMDNQQWSPDPAHGSITIESSSAGVQIHTSTMDVTVDDDEPVPTLTVPNLSFPELDSGRHNGAFIVTMTPGMQSFDVNYELIDASAVLNSDYSATKTGTLHFDASHSQVTVPFEIIGDTAREPHESIKLHLTRTSSYAPQISMPADAVLTILNDDAELTPSSARIARSQSIKFSLDIGLPPATPIDLTLHVSDSSVLSIPATVHFNAGQSTATFTGRGGATGTSRVSVDLLSGITLSSTVTVNDSGTVIFDPSSITAYTGEETTISLSLKPASTQTERLVLTSGNPAIATVPAEVTIPAGGTATLSVRGIAPGSTYINVTLPSAFGGGYATALIDVTDQPATPTITSIEPASGPAAGGTPFFAQGSLLTADCRLLFGGTPAVLLTLTSTGMFIGTTPPHAPGAVNVMLQCGTNTFVLTKAFTFVGAPRTRSARH